jgi:hypothetical protein
MNNYKLPTLPPEEEFGMMGIFDDFVIEWANESDDRGVPLIYFFDGSDEMRIPADKAQGAIDAYVSEYIKWLKHGVQ